MRVFLWLSIYITLLTGCAAATPILATQVSGHVVARSDEDRQVLIAAALKEEPNLLMLSVQAIAKGQSERAEKIFLAGYHNPHYSNDMKALALYQIGLMYMNQFNSKRDDAKAQRYFNKIKREFAQSPVVKQANIELKLIQQRRQHGLAVSAKELLKQVDRQALLAQDNKTFDDELLPMSERAIRTGRFAQAQGTYQILYANPGSSRQLRAQALYQIGLMLMSPYNPQGNTDKAIYTFRKLTQEFADLPISQAAHKRINQLINNQ